MASLKQVQEIVNCLSGEFAALTEDILLGGYRLSDNDVALIQQGLQIAYMSLLSVEEILSANLQSPPSDK